MQFSAAEFLGRHDFADRGFHERRPAEEDRALPSHDDGLVAHRGNVCPTRGARPHDGGDLRNPCGRHPRLVEEDAPEVISVGKDLILHGKECATRIDQADARQTVLQCDFLRPEVLLHGQRIVGAALHGGIVADDHHMPTVDESDAGHHPGRRRVAAIEAFRGEWGEFEEGTSLVEKAGDALAGQQLAAGDMTFARSFRAAASDRRQAVVQFGCEGSLVGHAISVDRVSCAPVAH